ncbi:Npt1/Npt2 family nucleotide transporter [Candidatus Nucleicultrix amoebiphila]|uniref:Npt1/Npt2 family nucleotide transporter n=1 Tax=Candidatus Nucleicultrix amoebiphila TaxID=1509244 RepID=UPI000A26AEED|nr:Npt1/Npt2 family nucleotide transporter [Candidatus Nucleicultrix amoebiphila]
MQSQEPSFSRLRNLFWPIQGNEAKKFLPMTLMMFFVLFNYTVLRNTKDALVVPAVGPEVIPFLKGYIIMPVAILFVTIYAKLANTLKRESLFYTGVSIFLIFFLVFALFLYPYRDLLHPSAETVQHLKILLPNIQHFISVFEVWTLSCFYIFSELWGTIVLGLLFWQFANQITKTKEAKRFYTMFGFLGHCALIAAGLAMKHFCAIQRQAGGAVDSCGDYLNALTISVVFCGLVIICIYYWMNRSVLTDPRYYDESASKAKSNEKKPKYTVFESFKHVVTSKYIGLIAILVLGYGICNNLAGLIWKKQLRLQYPTTLEYADFMGNFSIATGFATVILIFFFKGIVARFGWFRGAIITPTVLAITGGLFFSFILFGDYLATVTQFLSLTPLMMAVLIGSTQQVLSKCSKYSMFDPTKEMAYIPLDDDLKVKGKAAVDVIGHSFSKASGGYISSGLLILTAASDLMIVAPFMIAIFIAVVSVWILAVISLNKMYIRLVYEEEQRRKSDLFASVAAIQNS